MFQVFKSSRIIKNEMKVKNIDVIIPNKYVNKWFSEKDILENAFRPNVSFEELNINSNTAKNNVSIEPSTPNIVFNTCLAWSPDLSFKI